MITIQSFTFSPFQENTYVLHNEAKECIIIDPGCYDRNEQKVLESYISENGLTPIALLNTHCHLDHVFGNKFVSEKYGLTPFIHPKDQPVLDAVKRVVEMYGLNYDESPAPVYFEGDTFSAGDFKFDILFVPGHSPGHVAFYNAENKILISGDTLFRNSIGRTDLPGGDSDTLFESIRTQLFTLPDDTKVYAGHMEPTEIGFEKKTNPFFRN